MSEAIGRRQGIVPRDLQPLRVLVEHRVDDVDEGLVAVEEAVAAREQVALEPALAEVLAQDLHHPAVGGEVVVAVAALGHPGAVGHLEHRAQPVRRGLVGAEDAEVRARPRSARITSRSHPPSTRVASLAPAPGCSTSTA